MKYRKTRTTRDICVDILLSALRYAYHNIPDDKFIYEVNHLVQQGISLLENKR